MSTFMQQTPVTSTSKRPNKPLVEKRRRERINSSLEQMKVLVLENLAKDAGEYSKMEKADILEMTVGYLRDFQRMQHMKHAQKTETDYRTVTTNYTTGYNECLAEVSRYLQGSNNVTTNTKLHLLDHLASNVSSPSGAATQRQTAAPAPTATPLTNLTAHVRTPSPVQISTSPRADSPATSPLQYSPITTETVQVSPQYTSIPVQYYGQLSIIVSPTMSQLSPALSDDMHYQQSSLLRKMPVRHQKVWRPW